MSSNNALRKAKHEAYEKKQATKGKNVITFIFFGLIVLAAIYMIYVTVNM